MSGWAHRRVLVTGATGLVGSWLVPELLSRGARVTAFVRDLDPQSELLRSDCLRQTTVVNGRLEEYSDLERAVSEAEPEVVFHLGAQAIVGVANRSPLATFEANIRGTYNLLEACRAHLETIAAVVVASSDKAYGDSKVLPYTEVMPLNGRHPYDVSKSCADLLAATYAETFGLPVAVSRCGNIFGGGDLNWTRIVPGTIRSLLLGERPVIRSDGRFTRDYVYVKDIAQAYLLLAEWMTGGGTPGDSFNFSPGAPSSVLEIVATIQRLMGRTDLEPVILARATGEIRDQYLDAGKASSLLGWRPQYDLEAGLLETIAWYRRFLTAEEVRP